MALTIPMANLMLDARSYGLGPGLPHVHAKDVADRLREFLKRITYKPGSDFAVHEGICGPELMLRVQVPDTHQPHGTVTIHSGRSVSFEALDSDRDCLNLVRAVIRQFEMHEADEWLRLDGKIAFNPHGGELKP